MHLENGKILETKTNKLKEETGKSVQFSQNKTQKISKDVHGLQSTVNQLTLTGLYRTTLPTVTEDIPSTTWSLLDSCVCVCARARVPGLKFERTESSIRYSCTRSTMTELLNNQRSQSRSFELNESENENRAYQNQRCS